MGIYKEKNRRTMLRIQNAFIKILENKSFESITIRDITEAAQISRGTFYLHFQDKFDLLEQIEQQLFKNLGARIDELQFDSLSKQTFENAQEQLARMLFSSIKMQSPLLKIFLSNHGRAGFHIRFRDAFSEKVRFNLEKSERFNTNVKAPKEYFLAFITSAFLGLIEQWFQDGLDKTPEEMTVIYMEVITTMQIR